MFKHIKVLSLVLLSSCLGIFQLAASHIPHQGKKITHANMEIFNKILMANPLIMLRMNLTVDAMNKILNELDQAPQRSNLVMISEKEFVKNKLDIAIKPVKDFFDDIIKHGQFVCPLIEESTKNAGRESSLLLNFFKLNGSIDQFCEKEITTRTSLKSLCDEILIFFTDIETSLSDSAKQAKTKLLERINNSKRK